jgi:uncharacterized protein (DUF885 family)
MINSGIPIQNGNRQALQNLGLTADMQQQQQQQQQQQSQPRLNPRDLKPEALLAQIDHNLPRQATGTGRRDSEMQRIQTPSQTHYPFFDKSESVLAQAKWTPNAEYDQALREKLLLFYPSVRHQNQGRATLTQGLPQGRVTGDVALEKVPDYIKAIADEAEMESAASRKKEVDPVLPSCKKRKMQDVADTVDRGLKIEGEVETVSSQLRNRIVRRARTLTSQVMLRLADEHIDLISQVSCNLAKHRRSEAVDRKDVQLAYGEYPTSTRRSLSW